LGQPGVVQEPTKHRLELGFGRRLPVELLEHRAHAGRARTALAADPPERRLQPWERSPLGDQLIVDAPLQLIDTEHGAQVDQRPLTGCHPQAAAHGHVATLEIDLMDRYSGESVPPTPFNAEMDALVAHTHLQHGRGGLMTEHGLGDGNECGARSHLERDRHSRHGEHTARQALPLTVRHSPSTLPSRDIQIVEQRRQQHAVVPHRRSGQTFVIH